MNDERTDAADAYPLRTAASREDLRRFLAPLEAAFGEEIVEDDWGDLQATVEPDRVIAAFDGEASVGSAGSYSFSMTVPGGASVPVAGVTLVGVSPSHRRRGILRRLMRAQLDDIHGRGEPIAILWASEGAIYQRFGYGLATLAGTFEIDPARSGFLAPARAEGRVRIVGPDDALTSFPSVYEPIRAGTPGMLTRTETWWRSGLLRDAPHLRTENGRKVLAVLEVDGRPQAYAIYRIRPDWDARGPKGFVTAMEVLGASPAAERSMWRWLLDLDLVGTVRGIRGQADHPLLLALAEPRRMGLMLGDGLWLRLVDLSMALGARTYRIPGRLVLDVRDDFCAWNAGRWELDVPAGPEMGRLPGTARPTDAPADLGLDIRDLGAAYLGGISIETLARAGRVEELSPGAIARAAAMLGADVMPWCSTAF